VSGIVREERIGPHTLILGDCLKLMPLLAKVDAVVTDPPFGIKRDRGMGGGGASSLKNPVKAEVRRVYEGAWDQKRPDDVAFCLIMDCAPSAIIWGGQFFADLLPPQGKWLWWDKCQTMPSYGDGELAWTNLPGDAPKKFVYSNNGLQAREKDRVHPTQKPVALIEWCLGFLPDARTILDPFMGSGTTLVACQRLGRAGIGIELDPGYFDIACRRVEEAMRQPDLFIPQAKAPVQEGFDL
jgi:DNA modification methylase